MKERELKHPPTTPITTMYHNIHPNCCDVAVFKTDFFLKKSE